MSNVFGKPEWGGPAYPVSYAYGPDGARVTHVGMTLRDYFAAQAMVALIPTWPGSQVSGLAPFKVEGSTTAIDGYLATNYEWFVFNDLRSAFGAVPDVADETILRAINKLGDEAEGRFRKTRWRGTPLRLS